MSENREARVLLDAAAGGITSPRELANFMAQVTHESIGLNHLEESFLYTKDIRKIPVKYASRQGATVLEAARNEALQGKPEHLAELMYGGRMGNNEPGDGYKYHGRGYIQLTGKDNYRAAGDALGLDLVKHPELAAGPENASKIALWYWRNRVPEAAREDLKAATKAINGAHIGLEDREERFQQWEQKLTPEVMARLRSGEIGLPITPDKPPNTKAGHSATGMLRHGDHGEAVREMQRGLAQLGYHDASGLLLKDDGDLGLRAQHAVETFQHDYGLTVDGIAGPKTLAAIEHQNQLLETRTVPTLAPTFLRLDDASHPDHALFKQSRLAVHQLDAKQGRTPDQLSENLAASLTFAARRDGMSQINHVILSDDAARTFAVQGDLKSPLKQLTSVSTHEAINTPITASSAALAQLPHRDHAQAQAPQLALQQPLPQHAPLSMSR